MFTVYSSLVFPAVNGGIIWIWNKLTTLVFFFFKCNFHYSKLLLLLAWKNNLILMCCSRKYSYPSSLPLHWEILKPVNSSFSFKLPLKIVTSHPTPLESLVTLLGVARDIFWNHIQQLQIFLSCIHILLCRCQALQYFSGRQRQF